MNATSALSPELLDLMEHEKVIEQGLATFREVGWALLNIRDGKKYRAAGFKSFEKYCKERWDLSTTYAYNLMKAAELSSNEDVSSEGEARRILQERRQPVKRDHPAPFSDPILNTVAERVNGARIVLDPFAGTGRVHELRERANVTETIGIEIEPEWAGKHPDTRLGDALDLPLDDASVDAIATSPTYGNRMADHHDARDDSVRLTYKHSLGHDLHENNSGQLQWGDKYRDFHRRAYAESIRVLRPDGEFVINIKDHVRDDEKQEVAAWTINTMCRDLGMDLVALDVIPTRGLMTGENALIRWTVCAELVLTFRKPL